MSLGLENNTSKFLTVKTKKELANILGVEYKIMAYNLYKLSPQKKYKVFKIKKRNGKSRKITAPISGIKHIQKNLSIILLDIYPEKNCVNGFAKKKGIKTNASIHTKKKNILNIDLKEFFPSINFGRVRGLFMSYPFNFNEEVSTALAQICCFENMLPQGAPTSPIVSNFICRRLDNRLLNFSRKSKINYSRYADDITFSTNLKTLPKSLGVNKNMKFEPSKELSDIIKNNGFRINKEKTRFSTFHERQTVTGLVVNKVTNVNRKYVRNIRAMLNAWEKYGLHAAAFEHFLKFNYRNKKTSHQAFSFQNELAGKIGFIGHIKGKDNQVYKKLYERIKVLNPNVKLSIIQEARESASIPIIYGEGKTDWKHIKTALEFFNNKGEFKDIDVDFEKYTDKLKMNNNELLKICDVLSKTKFHKVKVICFFDRDDKRINDKVKDSSSDYKYWGKNVYSMLLPIPKNRNFEEICIEHYYDDETLKTKDKNGRRLYLSNEFDRETGKHITDDLTFVNQNYLKANYPRVIDHKVFNCGNGENVALSKNDFAELVVNKKGKFKKVNFENFKPFFNILKEILDKD